MQNGGEAAALAGQQAQMQATRDVNNELAQLEAELTQIEAQIAEFDRMNPGIASGDIDIAATMMEAGNYSPYQQAVNAEIGRRQMGESAKAGAMSGVWNGIDNARNALAGYAKMSDDQRAVALDLARTELDKAKRAANGSELPREYYDVLAKIDNPDTGDGMNNETYWRNSFTAKASKNNLHDTDIAELKKYADNNPNKELTAKLYAIVREFENSTVEGIAVHIIRAYLQAQPALQAPGRRIVVRMIDVRLRLVFPDIYILLLQVLLYGRPVYNQIMDNHEFPQRPDLDLFSLQVPEEGFTGERRCLVDHHRASAADSLHAGAFPADPRCPLSVNIKDVIVIVQVIQHAGHGVVLRTVIFKGFPVRLAAR